MWVKNFPIWVFLALILCACSNCGPDPQQISEETTAQKILGHPEYKAMCYGGYRYNTRDIQPTPEQIKQDLLIMYTMGIRIVRTYNVHLPLAENVLQAISELKKEDSSFNMYVMLGAWIDCKNAWSSSGIDHYGESERNKIEIERAVELTNQYKDIVKILAVGNEAMVKWATSYYVQPGVILKWVNYLQELKKNGKLSSDLWITSSDNYASWGGGSEDYHVDDLNQLIKAVDYISLHTYPMHETHYNYQFWIVPEDERGLTHKQMVDKAMVRAINVAEEQYKAVQSYVKALGVDKTIHIGETGWASQSNEHYGPTGSRACHEYKQGVYHRLIRDWSADHNVACFYFEAFDENWKDNKNPSGSENHFGLIDLQGQAKFALWDLVDAGVFNSLKRDGHSIVKSYDGDTSALIMHMLPPPFEYNTSHQ